MYRSSRQASATGHRQPPTSGATPATKAESSPASFIFSAIITSPPNQTNASHATPSDWMSLHWSTSRSRRAATPARATVVLEMSCQVPVAQRTSIATATPSIRLSARLIGPISARRLRARPRASGTGPTSGGQSR